MCIEGGDLRLGAPRGTLNAEAMEAIRQYKPALLRVLLDRGHSVELLPDLAFEALRLHVMTMLRNVVTGATGRPRARY